MSVTGRVLDTWTQRGERVAVESRWRTARQAILGSYRGGNHDDGPVPGYTHVRDPDEEVNGADVQETLHETLREFSSPTSSAKTNPATSTPEGDRDPCRHSDVASTNTPDE